MQGFSKDAYYFVTTFLTTYLFLLQPSVRPSPKPWSRTTRSVSMEVESFGCIGDFNICPANDHDVKEGCKPDWHPLVLMVILLLTHGKVIHIFRNAAVGELWHWLCYDKIVFKLPCQFSTANLTSQPYQKTISFINDFSDSKADILSAGTLFHHLPVRSKSFWGGSELKPVRLGPNHSDPG